MPRLTRYDGYAVAALAVAALTALLAPILDERHIVDVSLLYLLVTLVVAARWGYGVGIFTAIAADLCVNFFYIPPLHRFTVQEPVNLAGLVLFLCVALFGAYMLSRLREQAANARAREAETAFLLGATREIVRAETPRQALDRLCEVLARAADARGCAILSGPSLTIAGATIDEPSSAPATRDDIAVAKEVFRTDRPARITPAPGRKPARTVTFVPLHSTGVPALLRLVGDIPNQKLESPVVQALVNEASAALERARLSREAERANALERADEFKNVLLSSVSHDLRSPLTAIKAAVSSLRDESVDWSADDRRSFLETIESQSDRLTRTVSNLLEMSRLEGGTVRPSLEAIEVSLLFEDISLAVAPTLGARKFVVSGQPGLWVRADYGLLTQAITNLIENAVKYSVPAGPICLDAHGAPGRALISVSDSGPGIPPEDLPHLFEKFYRGKHVGTVIGTGLGLALVRAMVELCGGSVSVDSAPAGTRFTLSLPSTVAPQ